jgi:uncharacterized RDD family membrane protein YckC
MHTEPDQRFAPPSAHVEDVEVDAGELQLAGRGTRLGAAMIDLIIVLALFGAIALATPWNVWARTGGGIWSPRFSETLAGFAAFALLQGYLLAKRGQTIGKALLKIRIARPDGTPASLGRLLGLRYGIGYLFAVIPVAAQVWSLADALLIFRRSKRCLHDSIADTIVVKSR